MKETPSTPSVWEKVLQNAGASQRAKRKTSFRITVLSKSPQGKNAALFEGKCCSRGLVKCKGQVFFSQAERVQKKRTPPSTGRDKSITSREEGRKMGDVHKGHRKIFTITQTDKPEKGLAQVNQGGANWRKKV